MGLLRERCAELRKGLLQYCCNQVQMKNGGRIPSNVTSLFEMFETSWQMGKVEVRELGPTQYWNHFLIQPPLCKKLSHVRIDQCEEDVNSERNVDARSWNFTAPSSSRFAESSCRSNLIINFETSRQFWSNVTGSTSINFRSLYGIDTEDKVEFDVCCVLALARSFPVLLSPILSTRVSSDISVTFWLIPFTILTQEQV